MAAKKPKKVDTKVRYTTRALAKLQAHWGHSEFRPAQAKLIEAIGNGQDILGILPTGFGKSVVFQIPPLVDNKTVVVFSPLIALMKDQVDDCNRRGIPASFINSHLSFSQVQDRIADFCAGAFRVLYITPERLRNKDFLAAILPGLCHIAYVAVDEAHSVSRWGHAFRPMYRHIPILHDYMVENGFPRPVTVAVTATAPTEIEDDIIESLRMIDPVKIVADPVRPNLRYRLTHQAESLYTNAAHVITETDGKMIVYVSTQKETIEIANQLVSELGRDAGVGYYHGGMGKKDRTTFQDAFKAGVLRVMVATNAFGMGIDIPDIRCVYHVGIPASLEDYVQESGRAGRDGLPSTVILQWSAKVAHLRYFFLDMEHPPFHVLDKVWDWLNDNLNPDEFTAIKTDRIVASTVIESSSQVNACFRILEGKGVLRRLNSDDAPDAVVHLLKPDDGSLSGVRASIMDFIEQSVDDYQWADLAYDDLADYAGVATSTAQNAIRQLCDAGFISREEKFRGKPILIPHENFGKDLAELVTPTDIGAARLSAETRLERIKDYMNSDDPEGTIREYFGYDPES